VSAAAAVSVELVEDAGAAATEDEFFRSREFLGAEGTTHTLIVTDGASRAAVPLIVRPIPGSDRRDATSPYSYPGAATRGAPIDLAGADLTPSGLVSAFVRDRLGDPPAFAGPTDRSVVLLSDPELPRKSRMSDRQQIRKNEAAGYEVERVDGPAASDADLEGFLSVYTETMRVVSADQRYFFDAAYFRALLSFPRSWMVTVRGPEGDVAASALTATSDGFLHYYLSGTADAHRRRAPSKNLIVACTEHAEELGLPLNLGGGVKPGDGLEEFKRGFANREMPFRTHELVCDPAAYAELAAGRETEGFFPLYRAPA
jgi:hypothetical protein